MGSGGTTGVLSESIIESILRVDSARFGQIKCATNQKTKNKQINKCSYDVIRHVNDSVITFIMLTRRANSSFITCVGEVL